MAQRPGQTLANRQAIERAVQLTEQRAILRRRAVVGELFVVVVTTHTEPHLPAPAAQSPSRQACRDHREPAAQRARVAQRAEPGQHADEHVLHQVIDLAGAPEHAQRDAGDEPGMGAKHCVEGERHLDGHRRGTAVDHAQVSGDRQGHAELPGSGRSGLPGRMERLAAGKMAHGFVLAGSDST
jgi:hypothetical protein